MSYIVSVAYPKDTEFNLEYYLSSHMPLVQKLWGPMGLKSYKVVEYTNAESPYGVHTSLHWESKEKADKGLASSDAATILADIPNFSDKQPSFLSGETRATVSW